MKTIFNNKSTSKDIHKGFLTRKDLVPSERKIYDKVRPRLEKPTPDQLRMLAAYAYAANEFEKAGSNKELAEHLQRCMIFARNRLGLWTPEPVSITDLQLEWEGLESEDGNADWPPVYFFLSGLWEIMPAPANKNNLKDELKSIFEDARQRYKKVYKRVYNAFR